ncbi:MAG: aspartate carbamoyltransferase catalytic subunit [Bdellovibrionota bacterium]
MSEEEIRKILAVARAFANLKDSPAPALLSGMTVVNLFYENSTRTRTSFELAARKLGGAVLNFAASTSSANKGETLIDTARNIEAMKPNCIVVRHSSAGSPEVLARNVGIPVINAGDGFHEHPTQGLLDAYTIQEKLGDIRGKRVVILGDIAHSRVARSNIHVLHKLGATVAVCGPPTLLPPHPEALGVEFAYRPEKLLPQADVVMALRIQLERQNKMQIPSLAEYSSIWGLNRERAKLLKPGAIILHPGPVNRGVELDPEVADGPLSLILDQVSNGVVVRMAVLASVCNAAGLDQWLSAKGDKNA